MVTGLQSGDDASNIAANLAVVFSQLGLNTVLVDTDFYEPKVSELFSVNSDKGLLKALDDVDNGVLSENLIAISPTLSILPKGSAASSRQESATFFELLVSKHMREVLKNLKTKANATILVSPPLLHYSESLVLASKVDGVILVGYKDRSKRKYIHQAIEGLQAHGVKILGIVMVKDQPSTGSRKLNKTSKLNSSRQLIMADIRER
jgi:Mrp family chromosome partitioning ATPase